jgi:hypothetical protein
MAESSAPQEVRPTRAVKRQELRHPCKTLIRPARQAGTRTDRADGETAIGRTGRGAFPVGFGVTYLSARLYEVKTPSPLGRF